MPEVTFHEGSAGTGDTFTARAILVELAKGKKRLLICGTTGIAAVQYPYSRTIHSLLLLELLK
jgi:hypothetical protein